MVERPPVPRTRDPSAISTSSQAGCPPDREVGHPPRYPDSPSPDLQDQVDLIKGHHRGRSRHPPGGLRPHQFRTIITEFPDTRCKGAASSLKKPLLASARSAVLKDCGSISSSEFTKLKGSATITGVGYFDAIHGQIGVSPNGIELHPVLSYTGSSQSLRVAEVAAVARGTAPPGTRPASCATAGPTTTATAVAGTGRTTRSPASRTTSPVPTRTTPTRTITGWGASKANPGTRTGKGRRRLPLRSPAPLQSLVAHPVGGGRPAPVGDELVARPVAVPHDVGRLVSIGLIELDHVVALDGTPERFG
jgi:hypothetical protein